MQIQSNATAPLLPEIMALHGRWRADKPAVTYEGTVLSWADFTQRLCQVANGLAAAGLEKGDCAIVLMENCSQMAEAMFGIITGGFVCAPLNISVSDEAVINMIADSGAKAIFATPAQAERLDGLTARLPEKARNILICTGKVPEGWTAFDAWRAAQSPQPPNVQINPEDPMNIIYSSGTTGQPKGIVHSHQSRRDWAYDLTIAHKYHAGARVLAAIGLYSNINWIGMLCAFLSGGCLVIATRFDALKIWDDIDALGITHIAMVPVMYQRLLAADPGGVAGQSLEDVLCCGAPLLPDLKSALLDRFACGVTELYGLTEGMITTLDPKDARGKLRSVGKPLLGTDMLILDDQDAICPPMQPGEIVSRGRILMDGYLNRPMETQAAFWTDGQGRKWLRTGDIGYLDEDGFLFIVDRKKDMILSGGQNIYPQDIEAVLMRNDAVSAAAVIGVPSQNWGETPFAIVEVSAQISVADLVKWVNARLGKQQRIAGAAITATLPRNANGKTLKTELRQQYKDVRFD